jgi:hypothetical protein
MASITAKFDHVNETGMAMTITLTDDCGSETVIGIKSKPNARREFARWTYTVLEHDGSFWRMSSDRFLFNDRDTAQTNFDPENIFHAAYIIQMVKEEGNGWNEYYLAPKAAQNATCEIIEQRSA